MTPRNEEDASVHTSSPADETTALLGASHDVSKPGVDSSISATAELNNESLNGNSSGKFNNNHAHDEAGEHFSEDEKPLPKVQIFLLCYARMVEPVAFFCIFPFVNQMIWETGDIAESDVGFYSGMIESMFSLTQMAFMIPWGRAADRLGRKPVLVFSLSGVAIAVSLFGFSKTIWQMILFRCFAGVFAGIVVTIRTMISENCTHKTQARAFSFYAFAGNVGMFIGPFIGGALSNPAREYPAVFGKIQFFKTFPYALPTIISGGFGASAAIISALFINETRIKNKDTETASNSNEIMSIWEIIKSPGVKMVLYIYSHVMLLAFSFTAVLPVFWFTPPRLGGYGFSPFQISIFMCLVGVSQAIWLLLAFPYLQRRYSTGGVLRGCGIAYPLFFLFMPLGNFLLRQHWNLAFWITFPPTLAFGTGISMAFTAVQLALNDISPSAASLGTLNAIALTLICGLRAVTPALFTSIFATGLRIQIFQGYLVWVVMVGLAFGFTVVARYLPEKAEGKS